MDRLDGTLKSTKRSSLNGSKMRLHDEAEAERLFHAGLKRLGLDEADLLRMPKGAEEKAVLAWYLRKYTTVDRAWIAQRLVMGDESRITKLVQAVNQEKRYVKTRAKIEDS